MTTSVVTIRQVIVEDAAELLAWFASIQGDSGLIGRDTLPTLQEEREWLKPRVEGIRAISYVAVGTSGIIGMAGLEARSQSKTNHCATLGISLSPGFRGQNIGTRLMEHLHAWVRNHDIVERIQLEVLSTNLGAIRFYERLGYTHEGRRIDAIRRDGESIDLIQMSLVP